MQPAGSSAAQEQVEFDRTVARLARDLAGRITVVDLVAAVERERAAFADARERRFVPLLVERRVRRQLSGPATVFAGESTRLADRVAGVS
jgi:hypothetical protein